MGHTNSITKASFPVADEKYLVEDIKTYPVSFNGKTRFMLDMPATATAKEIEEAALAHDIAKKWLEGKPPKKIIVVPGKIINVVI
jgi:leucyl-tRNA synthetase